MLRESGTARAAKTLAVTLGIWSGPRPRHARMRGGLLLFATLWAGLLWSGAASAAPVNDDFDFATVIAANPFTDTVDTTTATTAIDDPSCSWTGATVWYALTPVERVAVVVDTIGSNYDTTLSAWTGTRGALTYLACSDDFFGVQSKIVFTAEAGQTYYIMAGGYGGSSGTLVLNARSVDPPPNDEAAGATIVPSLPFNDVLDTIGATAAPDDPAPCYTPNATVWYAYTAPEDLLVTVDATGSDYDATFTVLGGSLGAFSLVTCGYYSAQFTILSGETVYLEVGASSYGGQLVLTMHGVPPAPNDEIGNATPVTSLPYTDTVDLARASTAPDDPSTCYNPSNSVWYAYTPAADETVSVDTTGGGYFANVTVLTGTPGTLTVIGCDDTAMTFRARAGQTYYLMLASAGTPGSVNLSMLSLPDAIPPANDDIANATPIAPLPFTDSVDTRGASSAPDDPMHCFWPFNSVWYTYTATEDLKLFANAGGSDYGVVLIAFAGTPGALEGVACNYGSVSFPTQTGQTYYLMAAADYNAGNLVLSVEGLQPPANDNIANATPISTLPFTDTVDTRGASMAPDDPYYCFYPDYSVWYVFTPSTNATLTINASGDGWPGLTVFAGAPGALVYQTCSYGSLRLPVQAGQTYYVMVTSYSGGLLTFSVDQFLPPPNDDIANATPIPALPFSDSIDTRGATMAPDDPYYCVYPSYSVWYAYTPSANTTVRLDTTGSDYWPYLTVCTGAPGALAYETCGYGGMQFPVQAGQTYYLMVTSWDYGGYLSLTATEILPPSNDDISNAVAISSLPFGHTVDTSGATTATDDPDCAGNNLSVWYAFTPTEDVGIEADTRGTPYNTTLSVWTGTRGALQPIACNDDFYFTQSQVRFLAHSGQTYYVMAAAPPYEYGGPLSLQVREADDTILISAATLSNTLNGSPWQSHPRVDNDWNARTGWGIAYFDAISYAEFPFTVFRPGIYQADMFYGTMVDNLVVQFDVHEEGSSLHYTTPDIPLPNTWNWDSYTPSPSVGGIALRAGNYLFRVQNVSVVHTPQHVQNWNWGMDYSDITLTRTGDLPSMGTISGVVSASDLGVRVPNALVMANPPGQEILEPGPFWRSGYWTTTDATGAFSLPVPEGTYSVQAGRPDTYSLSGGTLGGVSVQSGRKTPANISLASLWANGTIRVELEYYSAKNPDSLYEDWTGIGLQPVIEGSNGYKLGFIDLGNWVDVFLDVGVNRGGFFTLTSYYTNEPMPGIVRYTTDGGDYTEGLQLPLTWGTPQSVEYEAPLYVHAGTNRIRCEIQEGTSDYDAFELRTPSPARLSVILRAEVKRLVDEGRLSIGQGVALVAQIASAEESMTRGNNKSAANAIAAFSNAVNALIRGRILPVDLGTRLTDGARQAIQGLGA